jgi:LytR cell envelope-related transcriptional attenuator
VRSPTAIGVGAGAARPPLPPAPSAPRRRSVDAPGAAIGSARTAEALSALERRGGEELVARRRRERAPKRSSAGRRAVIGGGALVVLAVVLIVVFALGGGSGHKTGSAATAGAHSGTARSAHRAHLSVAVLNATETNGLAHHVANQLQRSGYSRATPLGGHPPGADQVTVVEYTSGHKSDAEGVARSLGVSHTVPLESGVAALAGSASVVVVVGLDKASSGA